jgi:hypothetical protein
MHQNVETWERVASLAVGLSLIGLAARRRRFSDANAMAGFWFVARGASGYCPVNAAIGRTRHRDDTRAALGGKSVLERDERPVEPWWEEDRHPFGGLSTIP